ncbi:MAG: hypothetical protein LBL42_01705, partial [Tannerella sp.]|nr:hypothetical protein [Tannerella sp.]
ARTGHKTEDSSFSGYKTRTAMPEERIIAAAAVTPGEKTDGKRLPVPVETGRSNGMKADSVTGDTAYSGTANPEPANEEQIQPVSGLHPRTGQDCRRDGDCFDYNRDAGMYVCPAGHMAVRRTEESGRKEKKMPREVCHSDVNKCKVCSLREGCYRPDAGHKTYMVTVKPAVSGKNTGNGTGSKPEMQNLNTSMDMADPYPAVCMPCRCREPWPCLLQT